MLLRRHLIKRRTLRRPLVNIEARIVTLERQVNLFHGLIVLVVVVAVSVMLLGVTGETQPSVVEANRITIHDGNGHARLTLGLEEN